MGVAQYIIRRACGRGAYDPILDNATTEISVPARSSDGSYVQRYDARGRSENRISRSIKADQIHAKNAVLETVGVVERRRKMVNTRSPGSIGLHTLGKWDIIKSTPYMVGLFVRTLLNGWIYRLQASFLVRSTCFPFVVGTDMRSLGRLTAVCPSQRLFYRSSAGQIWRDCSRKASQQAQSEPWRSRP